MKLKSILSQRITALWDSEWLGELVDIEVEDCTRTSEELGDCSATACIENDDYCVTLLLADISAAVSASALVGAAAMSQLELKSIKNRIDTSAANAFSAIIEKIEHRAYIAASEAKDEFCSFIYDPLSRIKNTSEKTIGLAVDVIDGTTLAAKGLDGALTLSAAAKKLRPFPDVLAYTVIAPKNVLEKYSFFAIPEKEAPLFIENLSKSLGKPINELKIATHSLRNGLHTKLVDEMRKTGAAVIVPETVTIEAAFALGMVLGLPDAPDAVVGVFGLPEILISLVLLAVTNNKNEARFRIASNSLLSDLGARDLGKAFSYTESEIAELNRLSLSENAIYGKDDVSADYRDACFCASAITDNAALGMKGCMREGDTLRVETFFAGYGGRLFRIITRHSLHNGINYAACFAQTIDDISVVLPVQNSELIEHYNRFVNCLGSFGSKLVITPIRDLHVTLFEFGIHYGGFSPETELIAVIDSLKRFFKKSAGISGLTGKIVIAHDSIVLDVDIDPKIIACYQELEIPPSIFFNVNKTPGKLHITLGRFCKYLTKAEYEELSSRVHFLNSKYDFFPISGEPILVHITQAPYKHMRIERKDI